MTEHEKNKSVDFILSQGLIKPKTARAIIIEALKNLGFRNIFWDTGYSVLFALITAGATMFLALSAPPEYRYASAVVVAPLIFLSLSAFAEALEQVSGIYELKQTCRYTIGQTAALRTLCYSAVGIVFAGLAAGLNSNGNLKDFISLFSLCLSALFVCASLTITITRFSRKVWIRLGFAGIWLFISAAPIFLGGGETLQNWEALLERTPFFVGLIIALIGAIISVKQLSKTIMEGENYVNA